MTEQDLEIVNQEVEAPAEEAQNAEPENDAGPLSRDIVSKIVDRERTKAFEKGKQEALMELQQQQGQQAPQEQAPAQVQQGQTSLGGMQQFAPGELDKMLAERVPQILQDHVQKFKQEQMVESFASKMKAAEDKYPGLEAELNSLNYNDPRMIRFIEMANTVDNTGDIMKEVLDHPAKLTELLSNVADQPYIAQKQLMKLSQSIKTNQQALAEEAQARDPMSQLKPSQNAGMDNGAASVADFRKMFR